MEESEKSHPVGFLEVVAIVLVSWSNPKWFYVPVLARSLPGSAGGVPPRNLHILGGSLLPPIFPLSLTSQMCSTSSLEHRETVSLTVHDGCHLSHSPFHMRTRDLIFNIYSPFKDLTLFV